MLAKKIKYKVRQSILKIAFDLNFLQIDIDTVEQKLVEHLIIFSIQRPDIAYSSSVLKLAIHILITYLPFRNFDSYSSEEFDFEVYSLIVNLVMTSNHLPYFIQNEFDEISWRLNFFD